MERDVVVGRSVAVEDAARAFAKHAEHHELVLLCDPYETAEVEGRMPLGERVRVEDRRALLTPDALGLSALTELQFEVAAPFAARAIAKRALPITLLHHTLSYEELLHDAILRLLLAKARPWDSIVCTSQASRTALAELCAMVAERFEREHGARLAWGGRLDVIPLGIDTDRYKPRDRAAARARFGLPDDAFVILFLGRLSAIDKADLLPFVTAFAELSRRRSDRNLMLVCAGAEHPGERYGGAISSFASHVGVAERVRVFTDPAQFTPWKEDLYAAANAFLSPIDNVQETFGITPIEAMACGVPQIVSDWDGYRDTVEDGVTGFLLPTTWARCQGEVSHLAPLTSAPFEHVALARSVAVDTRAFVAAVEKLLDDPGLCESMAQASRRRAVERYSWPVVVAAYEALWRELADEAEKDSAPIADGHAYARPDWGRTFGHFASCTLDEGEALRLSPLGADLIAGKHRAPIGTGLDPKLVERILGGFAHANKKGEALSIARIVAVMSKAQGDGFTHDLLARHMMFLLKYGYIMRAG